ncbi:MAG: rhodanese-like domain-containing protein [Cyclobacteriaceae bacterium]|nr:rhodanese-like domain-containing protein [Cyclobacteriaceae bacterium]
MKVEQIYTGCLAEAAYYIESKGEAVIIDPLRETEPYLRRAKEDGAQIKYVLETHFHADFVSGHLDLANKSGATIVYGPTAKAEYDVHVAADGEELKVGDVIIKVLHTPGHTMESTTFLLMDENGKETALFTGDTLFIGDVGRPDLAVKSDLSREDLAGLLFDSLRNKIMTLPDELIVYPGHGAGSACGKNMSKETTDTLGNQKKFNYALRADMSREEFVKEVTEGLVDPPQYFPKNAVINKTGYNSFDHVLEKGLVGLSPDKFEEVANAEGAVVIDTRMDHQFRDGHVPNSIFVGLNGSYAVWVGTLITDINQPILIIAEPGNEEEAVTRLSRVGYDNTLGYLEGGFEAWQKAGKEVETIQQITSAQVADAMESETFNGLDVRKKSEYDAQYCPGFENFPLDFINRNMDKLTREKTYHIHCKGGYRSMIAASILKSRGFKLVDIEGGFDAMEKAGLKTTEYVCPSTLL